MIKWKLAAGTADSEVIAPHGPSRPLRAQAPPPHRAGGASSRAPLRAFSSRARSRPAPPRPSRPLPLGALRGAGGARGSGLGEALRRAGSSLVQLSRAQPSRAPHGACPWPRGSGAERGEPQLCGDGRERGAGGLNFCTAAGAGRRDAVLRAEPAAPACLGHGRDTVGGQR